MARLKFDTDLGSTLKAGTDFAATYEKVGKAVQGTTREMNALEKAAKRLVDQNLAPQEKYNQKLEMMAKAVKAGKITMDEATATAGKLRQRLDEATNSSSKLFGPQAISQLKDFFGSFASGAGAIGLVTQSRRDMDAAAKAAAASRMAALGSSGELAQLGDPNKLFSQASDIMGRGIVPDRIAANELVMGLTGAGLSQTDRESLLALSEKGLIAPQNVAPMGNALAKFQNNFGGTAESILDKAQAAAASSISGNLASTLAGSVEFAAAAKQQGISDVEALAASVVLERRSKDVGVASTQTKALFEAAQQKGLKSNTIEGLISEIEGKGGNVFSTLGRSEAVTAFQQLRDNRTSFREERARISAADSGNVATAAADSLSTNLDFQVDLARRRKEGGLKVTQEALHATRENLMGVVGAGYEKNAAAPPGWIANKLFQLGNFAGLDDSLLRLTLMEERSGMTNKLTAQEEGLIAKYLEQIVTNTQTTAEASRGVLQTPKPSGRQEQ